MARQIYENYLFNLPKFAISYEIARSRSTRFDNLSVIRIRPLIKPAANN